ncbi:putative transcriptional regulatory protein [Fusarium oxysporum f. sp. rapae]|uniref:Putative transcriptional regulatory protein n=1 Tax=Fusarium oxysporum f. sp. rapae TaxID=485398 RepID=A0A8J5PBA0_FUSOX|nr:putative transcriptional regulatory protein [Fusarium oxysporum f. sp. rapae]
MQKKISCKRCQYRKLKCSRTEPCESCAEANKPCEYRELDKKKRPVSSKYVSELEERIAYLEGLIIKIRDTVPEARSILSETAEFSETTLPPKSQSQPSPAVISPQPDNLEPDPEGSLIYHGPTSIIHGKLPQANRIATHPDDSTLDVNTEANFEQVAQHFGISLDNDLVTSALMHFFKWQYPQFMFIYREAFLRDHFGDRQSCKYWSSGLVLSICALGLLMSPSALQRRASEQFFSAAETTLIVYGFARPSIATVQAFLCLAFYEIGRGNMSKGWGFSGIAFRMAQDLGFQRDPKKWVACDTSLATPEDIEIRRRIVWGCYTSDKLISLTLGRPVYFSHHDIEVENLERLPDFPELELWLPIGFDSQKGDFGETKPMVPCFQKQIELSKIIEQILAALSSQSAAQDSFAYCGHLDKLNLELSRWETSLPQCAQWNKWESPSTLLIPSVASLHLLFHSIRIVTNIDAAAHHESPKSRDYCISSAQSIIALVRKYRSQYGMRFAPFVLIYSLAQASRY